MVVLMDISVNLDYFWWLLAALSITAAVIFSLIFCNRKALQRLGQRFLED